MKKIVGLTLVTMLGCGPGKNSTDSEGGSSGGSTGEATATTGVSTTTGPTGGNATDASGTGTGGVSDATSTSGGIDVTESGGGLTTGGEVTGGTTGGGGGDVMAECQAVCDLADACKLDPGPDCVAGCLGDFAGAMGECQLAIDAYLVCLAGMTCDELVDLFVNDNPGPCADAVAAAEMVCDMGMGDCTTGVGSNPQGTECSLSTDCPDQPTVEMQCTKDTCVCLVDGMEIASCPADNVCMTIDQIEAKAADCCGF